MPLNSNKQQKALSQKIVTYIPFAGLNTIYRALDKQVQNVLDIGCGDGELMKLIVSRRSLYSVGVDIFEPYLRNCKKLGSHSDLIRADIRELPIKPKSFDVVLCVEVLEHLDKAEGMQLLTAMEKIARTKVIITTPFGEHEQHAVDGDPEQAHKVIWTFKELKECGYKIHGKGLNMPRKTDNQGRTEFLLPIIFKPFGKLIWNLATPFTYFFPRFAGRGICIKIVKTEL